MKEEVYSADVQLEVVVLGAMQIDMIAVQDATETLRVDDFAIDSHRSIYRAMLEMWGDGDHIDTVTLFKHLTKKGQIDSIGGPSYLAFLTEGIPRNADIQSYVRLLKEKSLLRKAGSIFQLGLSRLQDPSEEARVVITSTQDDLDRALDDVQEEVTLEQQAMKTLETIRRQRLQEQQIFVTSGVEEIDFSHGGFALGEMTVIGARPNVGKSSMLRMAVSANCKKGDFCHLITPEMSADQVLRLFACWEARVPFRQVRHATRLTDAAMANVEAAMREVMFWPLKIEERSPISPADALSSFRSTKRKKGTKLCGLDYLQKLKYSGKVEHRHIYVTDAMVGFSSFAKTENVAFIAISSLTEPSGKDRNRVPTMDDFRQSGDIKYEANTAILLHREVTDDTQKLVPECSVIFGKARSDETGVKKIYFDPDYVRFESYQQFQMRFDTKPGAAY
jgi:replicative DNA helicase